MSHGLETDVDARNVAQQLHGHVLMVTWSWSSLIDAELIWCISRHFCIWHVWSHGVGYTEWECAKMKIKGHPYMQGNGKIWPCLWECRYWCWDDQRTPTIRMVWSHVQHRGANVHVRKAPLMRKLDEDNTRPREGTYTTLVCRSSDISHGPWSNIHAEVSFKDTSTLGMYWRSHGFGHGSVDRGAIVDACLYMWQWSYGGCHGFMDRRRCWC